MTKIYVTDYKKYSALIECGGKPVRIDFSGGRRNCGVFSTSDQALQDAIEESPNFKKGVIRLSETQGGAAKDAGNKPNVKVLEVANINEAVNYLVDKHGCDKKELNTWSKIRYKAASLGYDIQVKR